MKDLVDLLLSDMSDPQSRQALVEQALFGCPVLMKIDWTGAANTFTVNLVSTLLKYGACDSGEPAIVMLLEGLKTQRGLDKQVEIEEAIRRYSDIPVIDNGKEPAPSLPPPSPNPRMRDHLFISYAHSNRSLVDRLAEDLRKRGHIVWIDFEGIHGGDVWRQSIVDGIHASAVVLVVVTTDSLKSEWVAIEVQTAKTYNKTIIPLLAEKLTANDQLAYQTLGLDHIQYRDFTVGYETAFTALLHDLPQPQAGLPGYCQKLIAKLAQTSWGLDHYIQEHARLLPISASPYDERATVGQGENLLKQLWNQSRTIVLGEPGMGKTVALERLAWELARNDPPIIPVLLMLREYDGSDLLEWVRLKLRESNEPALRAALNTIPDTRNYLDSTPFTFYFLLDGLNEVRTPHRDAIVREIRRLSMDYPHHRLVVTSRVQDESWNDLREGSLNATILVLRPINEIQARNYLKAHLEQADADRLWERIDDRMRGLVTTPLLLWMMKEAWLESRERIPGNRGELYASFIQRMLRRDDDRRLNTTIPAEKRLAALEQLALAMHMEKSVSFSREQVKTIITDDALFNALMVNGLLQGDQNIRFAPHQTMQEHFAARALEDSVMKRVRTGGLGWLVQKAGFNRGDLEFARDSWWWETFIQLAGLTKDGNQLALVLADINPWLAWWCFEEGGKFDKQVRAAIGNKSQVLVYSSNVSERRSAVNALMNLKTPRAIPSLVWLSYDRDSGIAKTALSAVVQMGEDAIRALAKSFADEIGRASVRQRAELGRIIANYDLRPGVGLRSNDLPDIDWVEIPAGEFIYQEDQRLKLPAFQMARYPVTYAQFQAFIDAPDGFYNVEWWEGLAVNEQQRSEPDKQNFKYDNHPRETVSWYEAVAFCRWLSAKLGYKVRLPTEQEWEKAARGTDGRGYPYKDKFDASKGNTRETSIGQTSAVGIFPDGASPFGVLDMSGNVWQWCLNEYSNPNRIQIEGSERRVSRGGSWNDLLGGTRSAYRGSSRPYSRHEGLGFRVLRP